MLIQCVECSREISDQAAACPHCGCPQGRAGAVPPGDAITPASKKKAAPIFLSLAVIAVIVAEGTPRLLIFFPVMAILGFSVVSLARGERWSGWAWLTLLLGFVTWGMSSSDLSTTSRTKSTAEAAEKSVRIASSRWVKKPDFAGRGAIEWVVEVENISDKNIRSVEIEFTSYDSAGKIVSTDNGYARAISPASRASAQGYADYYRTEQTASFRVRRVNFE